jgi:hypothetical protein
MKDGFKNEWLIWFIPTIVLIVALLPFPSEYYRMLRLVVTASTGYIIYLQLKHLQMSLGLLFIIAVCILYNPIIPIHFVKEIWNYLNLLSGFIIMIHMFVNGNEIITYMKEN